MTPSGYAGFTTLMRTVITPMRRPYQNLPVSVIDADTGSVAIKTNPNAKLPITKCQCQGTPNMGLLSEPIKLKNEESATMPTKTPNIIRHAPILVNSKIAQPTRIASIDVSPIEPCLFPIKASNHVRFCCTASIPFVAATDNIVAPV